MSASAAGVGGVGGVGIRPPLTAAEKYEKLAFTFCKLGTAGLIAWILTPPVMVLVVALVAIGLYVRSVSLGSSWTKCFLRRPTLVIAVWAVIAVADAVWLFVLGQRLPAL